MDSIYDFQDEFNSNMLVLLVWLVCLYKQNITSKQKRHKLYKQCSGILISLRYEQYRQATDLPQNVVNYIKEHIQ